MLNQNTEEEIIKRKVSILIYSLASGGAERVVSILLNEIKDTFDFTLVLMNDTVFYDLPEDINIVYLEKSNPMESGIYKLLKLPILGYKYKKICNDNQIDVSLSFMNRPNYINLFSKLFGYSPKIIISERNTPSKVYEENNFKNKISRYLIKYLYRIADKIVPNAKGIKYDLEENFRLNSDIIQVVNNPIDINKVYSLKNEKVDFSFDEKFTFINIGSLHSQKNHELLIDAFFELNCDHCQLLIIGDGELKNVLQEKIEKLNLSKQVFLLGRKKNPYKYLNKADCFVLSSNYEGFPNVLLEALACGLPVISTDCQSGPREILAPKTNLKTVVTDEVEFGEFGVLTPVNNVKYLKEAIEAIYHDNSFAQKYTLLSVKRAKEFDVGSMCQEFVSVINEKENFSKNSGIKVK